MRAGDAISKISYLGLWPALKIVYVRAWCHRNGFITCDRGSLSTHCATCLSLHDSSPKTESSSTRRIRPEWLVTMLATKQKIRQHNRQGEIPFLCSSPPPWLARAEQRRFPSWCSGCCQTPHPQERVSHQSVLQLWSSSCSCWGGKIIHELPFSLSFT